MYRAARRHRRAGRCGRALEPLEERALPSALLSYGLSTPAIVPENPRAAELDSSSSGPRRPDREDPTSNDGSTHAAHDAPSGGSSDSTSAFRPAVDALPVGRRTVSTFNLAREPLVSSALLARVDSSLVPVGDDLSSLEPGLIADPGDGAAVVSAIGGLAGLPGWGNTSTSDLLTMGLYVRSGSGGSMTVLAGTSPGWDAPQDDTRALLTDTLDPGSGGAAGQARPESLDRPEPVTTVPAEPSLNWTTLVEVALRGDWDALDAELEQFLARLGRADGESETTGETTTVCLWIGIAAVAMAARGASRRGGARSSRRRGVAGDPPPTIGSVGPWPLGPS